MIQHILHSDDSGVCPAAGQKLRRCCNHERPKILTFGNPVTRPGARGSPVGGQLQEIQVGQQE